MGRCSGLASQHLEHDAVLSFNLFNPALGAIPSAINLQPGFLQLKLVRGPKGLSCFIEFNDVATATACHDRQQGAILQSSDRGGIRIQFSKNPFGRKRDALGNPVEAQTVQGQVQVPAAAAAQATTAQQQQQQMQQLGAQQPQAARAGGEVPGVPSTEPVANADQQRQQQAQVNGSSTPAVQP